MNCYIPFHAKDAGVLPLTVETAREFIRPTITRVVVVSAYPPKLAGVEWLDESAVIPDLPRRAMPQLMFGNIDRTGWYFQQLLKYGVADHTREPFYLCLDADVVTIKPTEVVRDGKYVFQRDKQWHAPYFDAYDRLIGEKARNQASFIADHMVFDVAKLNNMLAHIVLRSRRPWWRAILDCVCGLNISEFSEFETYGNWLSDHDPDCFVSEHHDSATVPHAAAFYHPWVRYCVGGNDTAIDYHNRPGFNPQWRTP
jgi:hypothetical protein